MDKELKRLIDNANNALWELQEYFNSQPKEEIPNYLGTCKNQGALKIYQIRIHFNERFPSKG